MLNFLGTATLFAQRRPRARPGRQRERAAAPPPRSLSPSSMAALLLSAGAVTVVAVCVSLVTVGVRYLFMRLLALHVFLEECLFKPLAHFLSHCFSIVF